MDGRYLGNSMRGDTRQRMGSHYWVTVNGCRCCITLEFLIAFPAERGNIIVELQQTGPMEVARPANDGEVVCGGLIGLAGHKSFDPGLLERVSRDRLVELTVSSVCTAQRSERI